MNKNVVVIGGGVFGRTVAATLRLEGHQVQIFDCLKKESGSPPSGGLMKPSWLSFLSKKEIDQSFELLNNLFGVAEVTIRVGSKDVKFYRLNMKAVMSGSTIRERATKILPGKVEFQQAACLTNVIVIVAAGYWSRNLLDLPEMRGKKGVSYTLNNTGINGSVIVPWAPYKQVVALDNHDNSHWCSDGTAILSQNWKAEQELISYQRIRDKLGLNRNLKASNTIIGIRPVMPNGYRKLASDLYLITGAGKNGSAMAGVYAARLAKDLA